jgi:glycine cleavage system aminomethyltransferase T
MGSLLSPLDDMLKRSGAHMTEREGWLVAADFGSLAAEIAVSRATAGLADVSSISKFEVQGSATAIADMYPSGRELRPGRALEAADAWWCVLTHESLLVLASPSRSARVRADLDERAYRDTRIADVTSNRVAVCLTGPFAREVVTRAGATPIGPGSVRVDSVGGVPTLVVHQYEKQWLLVAPATEAAALWQTLTEAGSQFGLAYVGADALQNLHAAATSWGLVAAAPPCDPADPSFPAPH